MTVRGPVSPRVPPQRRFVQQVGAEVSRCFAAPWEAALWEGAWATDPLGQAGLEKTKAAAVQNLNNITMATK